MSEHMEMFGTGALSLDNKGDDGEEDLGVPKEEDNNDDEEPGSVCMYACVLFITRWQWQSAGSSPTNAGAITYQCHRCRYILPPQTPEGS